MSKWKKYRHLTPLEKKLFRKAYFAMFYIRPVVFLFPFKWYVHWLGEKEQETENQQLENEEAYIIIVKDTLRRIIRYHLFKPKCLAEAIVARKLLLLKEIPSTIYLGVAKNEKNKMMAHAWLRCGDIIVTGKKGMEKFTIVTKFS